LVLKEKGDISVALSTSAPLMGKISKLFKLGLFDTNRQVYSGKSEGIAFSADFDHHFPLESDHPKVLMINRINWLMDCGIQWSK
jgi:hypothetical protein